jgi:hypothetical protein
LRPRREERDDKKVPFYPRVTGPARKLTTNHCGHRLS